MDLKDLSRPSAGDGHRQRTKRAKTGGRKRGSKNKATKLMERAAKLDLAKRTGEKLAVDLLRDTANLAAQAIQIVKPYDDEGAKRKTGDLEKFFRYAALLKDCAIPLAQYESPRLSAVAIAPPQRKEYTRITLNVFEDDKQIDKVIDVESVPFDTIEG